MKFTLGHNIGYKAFDACPHISTGFPKQLRFRLRACCFEGDSAPLTLRGGRPSSNPPLASTLQVPFAFVGGPQDCR